MKKLSAFILAIALALFLSACGSGVNNNPSAGTGNDSSTATADNKSIDDKIKLPDESKSEPVLDTQDNQLFVPNEDLQVITAFVYDNDTYVVVENKGNQAVLNYRVAYINFDKNGFVATRDSDGYEGGKADTANIMPGSKSLAGWYGADGEYAVATVVGVDYADGTTWEADSVKIDHWANATSKEFSLETHKANLASLKEAGALAESNEYAALTDFNLKHGNKFSNKHDFHFSVENMSNQGILSLNLFVLEFDENGFPVSVSPYDTYCINGHRTGGTVNLAAGNSSSYSDDLFIQGTTTQVKTVISYIKFQDGTEWNNPYLYEWIIGNSSAY